MSTNKEARVGSRWGFHLPSTVVVFRSGAKGNAHISDSFGSNAGAASHKLIQMDSHFLVVRELSIHPVPSIHHQHYILLLFSPQTYKHFTTVYTNTNTTTQISNKWKICGWVMGRWVSDIDFLFITRASTH